jgi:Protein of unknown function, DUF481
MRTWIVRILAVVMILGTCAVAAARPKTDIVLLKNGDRVTCEIKNLTRGKLEVKTDSMDKLYIEWADVDTLTSRFNFHVTASNGDFYYGVIEIREATGVLRVVSDTTIVNLPMLSAVSIVPIDKSFQSKNKGSAKIGFNYATSTDVAEFYLDFTDRYRTRRNIVDVFVETDLTNQDEPEGTKRRATIGTVYYRILPRSITASAGAKVERNDELDVKMRFLGRLAAGYDRIATNQNSLMLAAGFAFNAETSYSTGEQTTSLEGLLYMDYSIFRYNFPKTEFDAIASLYPSITEQGRVRSELTLDVRREIVYNFFFDLEFYDNYDNKPPSGGKASNDYGIKTSLSYSWN